MHITVLNFDENVCSFLRQCCSCLLSLSWIRNAVSSDKFVDQTAMVLKGMPMSAYLVNERINTFPIISYSF